MSDNIEILPLTENHWSDFETLFGKSGCGGCWCLWWRVSNKEFSKLGKDGHKESMRTLVHQGGEPGLIAYVDEIPAGWVAVAPRTEYHRLSTSRLFAPVDDQPVWSIPCFFIRSKFRGQGLMHLLIAAAVDYAKAHGAKIIESYPYEPNKLANPLSIYTGVPSAFESAGFVEVARRKENRPVMRKTI